MIIKLTPWERRNLGVKSSVEYYVSTTDSIDDICDTWASNYEYQVLHIETGNAGALLKSQENGFRVIEMNIQLKRSLDDVILPGLFKRYEDVINYHYADQSELRDILKAVKSGEMFLTDKIALDPFFSKKRSGERYAYWAEDILKSGAITVMTQYKNQPIGFEMYTEKDGICTNFIGGIFPEYNSKSLGFAPLFTELSDQRRRGNKCVETGVSSNNIPVLKLHEMLGFKVSGMSYTLVKHI